MPGTFQRFCGLKWPAVRCGNQAQCILARCGLPEIGSPALFSGFCRDVRAFAKAKREGGARASGGGVTLAALNLALAPGLAFFKAKCSDSFQGAVLPCGQGQAQAVGVKGACGILAFGHVCGNAALTLQAELANSFKCGKFFHGYILMRQARMWLSCERRRPAHRVSTP